MFRLCEGRGHFFNAMCMWKLMALSIRKNIVCGMWFYEIGIYWWMTGSPRRYKDLHIGLSMKLNKYAICILIDKTWEIV